MISGPSSFGELEMVSAADIPPRTLERARNAVFVNVVFSVVKLSSTLRALMPFFHWYSPEARSCTGTPFSCNSLADIFVSLKKNESPRSDVIVIRAETVPRRFPALEENWGVFNNRI